MTHYHRKSSAHCLECDTPFTTGVPAYRWYWCENKDCPMKGIGFTPKALQSMVNKICQIVFKED